MAKITKVTIFFSCEKSFQFKLHASEGALRRSSRGSWFGLTLLGVLCSNLEEWCSNASPGSKVRPARPEETLVPVGAPRKNFENKNFHTTARICACFDDGWCKY